MNGKNKCKILKEIRQKIADDNDIAYVTSECKHQGDCKGTCPKCEAEVQYLENELRKRQAAGKAIAVAGIAAALMLGATGCAASSPEVDSTTSITSSTGDQEDLGEVPDDETGPDSDDLAGVPPIEDELMGDPVESQPGTDVEDPFYDEEPGVDTEDGWGTIH